jgi:methyltransferase
MIMNAFVVFAIVGAIINRAVVTKWVLTKDKEKGEIHAGWITRLVFLFYPLIFFAPLAEFLIVRRPVNVAVSLAAFVMYGTGMFLRLWAVRSLGKYWSTEIEIRDRQVLVKKGPYRYMRHPHYFFIFSEVLGVPLIANAYYSLALLAAIYVPLIALRIIFEEKALAAKFGEQYARYRRQVWGLFPVPVFKEGVRE